MLYILISFFVAAYCYYRKGAPCGPQWLKNKAARRRMARLTSVTPVVRYTRQLQQKVGNWIHITKGLLTLVDQSRTCIRRNHIDIIELLHHQKVIGKYVNSLNGRMEGLEKRLHAVEARLEMNRAIEDAERIYEIYRQ